MDKFDALCQGLSSRSWMGGVIFPSRGLLAPDARSTLHQPQHEFSRGVIPELFWHLAQRVTTDLWVSFVVFHAQNHLWFRTTCIYKHNPSPPICEDERAVNESTLKIGNIRGKQFERTVLKSKTNFALDFPNDDFSIFISQNNDLKIPNTHSHKKVNERHCPLQPRRWVLQKENSTSHTNNSTCVHV